jgi:hypothetical protein
MNESLMASIESLIEQGKRIATLEEQVRVLEILDNNVTDSALLKKLTDLIAGEPIG